MRIMLRLRFLVPVATMFCLIMCTSALYAQDTADTREYNEVLSSFVSQDISLHESRLWQDPALVAENVVVVTQKDIERLPARNVAEVLSYVPGLALDTRTGFSHPVTYSLHASEPRHMRVMIDGIDFNNDVSGQSVLAEIPIVHIERIEIIKGPVSSKWGSSLGGIVNIITKKPVDSLVPRGSVSTVLSEYKQRRYSGDIAGGIERFGYYAAGEYGEAGGIRNYDDTLNRNAFGKTSCTIGDMGTLTTSLGYMGADESEGPYPDFSWQKQDYYSRFGKTRLDIVPNERSQYRLEADVNNQSQRLYDSYDSRSEFRDEVLGLSGEAVYRFRTADTLLFGVDLDRAEITSLSMRTSPTVWSDAAYTTYTLQTGPVAVTPGVRYDYSDVFEDQVNPSVGAVYELPYLRDSRVRASVSRGFNTPALQWLYYDTATFQSNRNLKAERSWVEELGFESRHFSRLWLKANVFQADVMDFITSEVINGIAYMRNNKRFRHRGVEVETKLGIGGGFSILGAGMINDVMDHTTHETVYSNAIARQKAQCGILYEHTCGLSVSLLSTYERYRAPGYEPHETGMIWDAKIAQTIPLYKSISIKGYLAVHNIGNSVYWHDIYYPYPPRYFEGGITVYF